MHARFRINGDRIDQIEGSGAPTAASAAHVAEANAWYQEIRSACFAE